MNRIPCSDLNIILEFCFLVWYLSFITISGEMSAVTVEITAPWN